MVVDSAGTEIDPAQVTIDRTAGTVTFADPLALQDAGSNALVPPLSVVDRIEQMSVVSDVQINGAVSVIAPLAWDFPAGSTLSSAVVYGDLQARAKDIFTQRTWDDGNPTGRRLVSATTPRPSTT